MKQPPTSEGAQELRKRRGEASGEDFAEHALREFRALVDATDFPCLGAKAAFNAESYVLRGYGSIGSGATSVGLAQDLRAFTRSNLRAASEYSTFIAVFRDSSIQNEADFEAKLWCQLRRLNRIDAAHGDEWDQTVASDPADPHFSFSFAGQALYVIGLHPQSSRQARRFPWPALVFNPHAQFERLRADGHWRRMQAAIRARDIALQGSINPMLTDFGEKSEARQYSGREVDESWHPPFVAVAPKATGRCPFAH